MKTTERFLDYGFYRQQWQKCSHANRYELFTRFEKGDMFGGISGDIRKGKKQGEDIDECNGRRLDRKIFFFSTGENRNALTVTSHSKKVQQQTNVSFNRIDKKALFEMTVLQTQFALYFFQNVKKYHVTIALKSLLYDIFRIRFLRE